MKIQRILPVFFALLLLGACKSPTTITVNNDVGTLQGKVALYTNCTPLANDSGASVSIEGTGFSAATNSLGDWTMNNVPAGIYNIIITKPGFDTDLIAQDQFSGAGTQFLENGMIRSTSPLLDSVLISSAQITKKDTMFYWIWDSTTKAFVYDTTGLTAYQYFLNITFTMRGSDSSILFGANAKDITRPACEFGSVPAQSLSTSGSLVSNLACFATDFNGIITSAQPGDSIVVKTIPLSSCDGRKGDTLSKVFVLP